MLLAMQGDMTMLLICFAVLSLLLCFVVSTEDADANVTENSVPVTVRENDNR